MKNHRFSRRGFLKKSTGLALAAAFIPRRAWGAGDRINVGCVGIGGKGAGEVTDVAAAGGNIVALCDVDDNRRRRKGKDMVERFPKARFYRDFRVMLEKEEKHLDAITVSTPDHTHVHPSVMAMRLGKHVYCQKPLTHSIGEARLMAETAARFKVATQMGNQAHAGEPIRRAVEWIRAGLLGKVRAVHCWTNRPTWPQGMTQRPEPEPIPAGLDWDLWLGPAAARPYASAYVPFKWRGWWDFGTGALGDMGCHIMDMPYWALDLQYPTSVEATSEGNTAESGPTAATITYRFPAGPYCDELTYTWYDGGRMPADDVIAEARLPDKPSVQEAAKRFDLVLIGEKGKMFFKRSNTEWLVAPAELGKQFAPPEPSIARVRSEDHEWLDACRGGPPALSNFAYAGRLTEFVLLGNLAVRLGRKIEWDGKNMRAANAPEAAALVRREYRKGWEL